MPDNPIIEAAISMMNVAVPGIEVLATGAKALQVPPGLETFPKNWQKQLGTIPVA